MSHRGWSFLHRDAHIELPVPRFSTLVSIRTLDQELRPVVKNFLPPIFCSLWLRKTAAPPKHQLDKSESEH